MMVDNEFRCTDIAWEYGVPLVGTATRADIWLLLEYIGRWEAKAFEQSHIPEHVKKHIQELSTPETSVRTQLIRQAGNRQDGHLAFFAAQVSPLEPRLYEYQLDDYRDILDLDLPALVAGESGKPNHLREEPLYLVCTNGRRDQCCALYGPEVYTALNEKAGKSVWQTSHLGGHNKAPVTLFFPHGVNYGHTTPPEARRLVQAYRDRKIILHHYRGRVCFEPHVQAAEYFWREHTGVLELPGLQIDSVAELGPDQWVVAVSDTSGEKTEMIRLLRRESDYTIPITCNKSKERPISSFHRIE